MERMLRRAMEERCVSFYFAIPFSLSMLTCPRPSYPLRRTARASGCVSVSLLDVFLLLQFFSCVRFLSFPFLNAGRRAEFHQHCFRFVCLPTVRFWRSDLIAKRGRERRRKVKRWGRSHSQAKPKRSGRTSTLRRDEKKNKLCCTSERHRLSPPFSSSILLVFPFPPSS
jgi:hypothetical protein